MLTHRSRGSDDNEVSTEFLSAVDFVAGENILAVMVKQRSESSSDLSFDLRLELEVLGDDPTELCEAPGDDDDSGTDACSCGEGGTGAAFLPLLLLGLRRERERDR